jgi:class 3 adenylate cyclase/tetratricopeptide (TPR) repeat protein
MQNVEQFLGALGLSQYAQRFAENFVDWSVLPDLTDQDLVSLGIPLGHRKKILRAIAELDGPAGVAPPARQDEPERRQLTVMFCDMVGSTALSERLDPEDMRDVIGAYQAACAGVISRYEGFISQYLGDGILVYFGYPRAHEDDAERAVRAGLEMVRAVADLATSAGEPLLVRVGIATGIVVVGDVIGEGASLQQMAIGPTPNLAARLQSVAEAGSVIVADSTRRLLGDVFALRELPSQVLKGIADPVKAWAVDGLSRAESRFDAARSVGLTEFVGRERELEILLERQARAWQGSGQAVVILGEPGIGKSRLTGAFRERISAAPQTRLRYQCSPYHTNSALYPFVRQLEQVAGLAPDDTPEAITAKITKLIATVPNQSPDVVPLFAALFSGGEQHLRLGLSSAQQRRRTLEALLEQLEGLSQLGPVLILFEDVHWADGTSLELLELVIERIRNLPVLLLLTTRPDFKIPWTRSQHVCVIQLARLEGAAVDTIIECVTGGYPLPAEVRDQIVAKTDGVPLFVEELTKAVLEAGILVREERRYRLNGPLPPFAIPTTLHDSLMARLDRLGAAKEVAQVGAAIGRQFFQAILKTVMARDSGELQAALAKLESADLIASRGHDTEAVHRFKHALVQDTAYESLLKSRRQVVHHRIAEAIREQFHAIAETEPEIIAYHYTQAGLAELAIEWWTRASEWARSRSAYAEAVAHLRKALELCEGLPATPESRSLALKVQLRYGRTLFAAKGWASPEATEAFARAQELAAEVNDPTERIAIDFVVWYCNTTQGAPAPLGPSSAAFFETAARFPNHPLSLQLGALVNYFTSWLTGDYKGARKLSETRSPVNYSKDSQPSPYLMDLNPEVTRHAYLALIVWPLGDVDRAIKEKEAGLALALEKGDIATLANTLAHGCYFEGLCRNFAKAEEHATALAALAREHRLEGWTATAAFYMGLGRFHQGEREAGMTQMIEAGGPAIRLGAGLWASLNASLLAEAEVRHHGINAGLARLDLILAEVHRSGIGWLEPELHRARAQMLLERNPDDVEAIESAYDEALQIARRQNAKTFELRAALGLAQFYHLTERSAAARAVLAPAVLGFAPEVGFAEGARATQLLAELS